MVPTVARTGTVSIPASAGRPLVSKSRRLRVLIRQLLLPVPIAWLLLVALACGLISTFALAYEVQRVQVTAQEQFEALVRQLVLAADQHLADGTAGQLQDDLNLATIGRPDLIELKVVDPAGRVVARVKRAAVGNGPAFSAVVPTVSGGSVQVSSRRPSVAAASSGFGAALLAMNMLILAVGALVAGRLSRQTYGPLQRFAEVAGTLTRDRFAQEDPPQLRDEWLQGVLDRLWVTGRTLTERERQLVLQNTVWQRRHNQARALIDLMAEFNQVMVLRAVLERLSLGLSRFFAGDAVAIWVWPAPQGDLELAAQVAGSFPARISSSDPWVQQVLAAGATPTRYPWIHEALPSMAMPLLDAQGRIIGIVVLTSTRRSDYSSEEHAFLRTVIAHAAMAIQNAAAYERTDALSRTDGLTGLQNRREFDRILEQHVERARRAGHPLSLMMIDIDHFKHINDERGHQTGDLALRQLSALIQSVPVRPADAAFRFGGEEFAVLLTETEKPDAMARAEYLRALAANTTFLANGLRLTVSLGVATFPADGLDAAGLVSAADRALYQAKNAGRNRVHAA